MKRDELSSNWGPYSHGQRIDGERILRYLEQFGDPRDQRLVFQILRGIHFIGFTDESRMLSEFYRYLGTQMKKRYGDWSRNRIRVSYVGPPGKSSAAMARLFVKENGLLRGEGGVVSPAGLKAAGSRGVKDVVLIDDFVGSGDSLVEYINEFSRFVSDDQYVYLFIVAGMIRGVEAVTRGAEQALGRDRVSVRCLHEIPKRTGSIRFGI